MSHTPGPWTAIETPLDPVAATILRDSDDEPFVTIRASKHAEADARLIAAAPDLLAALEGWLAADAAVIETANRRPFDANASASASIACGLRRQDAHAAIAKATGAEVSA